MMRSSSRSSPFFILQVALAAGLAVLGTGAQSRPRSHPRAASPGASEPSYIVSGLDGQSMIRQQPGSLGTPASAAAAAGGSGQAQARPGFIGGSEDGQSIRRTQPRHHGGNHPHRGR
jgi:hypothetical protein